VVEILRTFRHAADDPAGLIKGDDERSLSVMGSTYRRTIMPAHWRVHDLVPCTIKEEMTSPQAGEDHRGHSAKLGKRNGKLEKNY